jgi:hypothetical protein
MEIDKMRDEVEAALREALAARPALFAAVAAATRAGHDAQHRWENFGLAVARGTRHGQDTLTGAVARLIDEARRERDRAAAELTLAKRHLGNLDWEIGCRRAEIQQLELVASPPVEGRSRLYEIAKRPTRRVWSPTTLSFRPASGQTERYEMSGARSPAVGARPTAARRQRLFRPGQRRRAEF